MNKYNDFKCLNNWLVWQFCEGYDRCYATDYVTIYDVNDGKTSTMIAKLTGSDDGPIKSEQDWMNTHWKKKVISSSSNNMLVEFRSDDFLQSMGFSASIHYSTLPNKLCEKGLNMAMKTLQSPNYPNVYENDLNCKWLISVPHGFYITLKFLQFDVRFFRNFDS